MSRTPRRTLALGAASTLAALLLTATGCAEATLEVGDTTTVSQESAAPSSDETPDPASVTVTAVALDPRLNPEPTVLGRDGTLQAHLPLGWAAIAGSDIAAAGDGAALAGGTTVTSVPAEGRSQDEWAQALMAGETDLFADTEGMEAREPVTTPSGLTLFHLAQVYSDNRAQLFGTVVDDTLHLVRFGLPGTDEAVEVAALSATTLALT